MPRSVEWIGRTHDSDPTDTCKARVYKAQLGNCNKCGRPLRPHHWSTDHVIPLEDGGENRESNLQALCNIPCHSKKTAEENSARAEAKRAYQKHIGVPERLKTKTQRRASRYRKKYCRETGRFETWDIFTKDFVLRRKA